MKTFLTSDSHYSHRNILFFCNRPFKDVDDMNERMIGLWNETVGKEDVVYHLGDFALGDKNLVAPVRKRLNGKICLIKGNHDRNKKFMLEAGFDEIYEFSHTIEIDGAKLFLRHKPCFDENKFSSCDYHICGHVHDTWTRFKNIINAGVDIWDYKPVLLEQLITTKDEWVDPVNTWAKNNPSYAKNIAGHFVAVHPTECNLIMSAESNSQLVALLRSSGLLGKVVIGEIKNG